MARATSELAPSIRCTHARIPTSVHTQISTGPELQAVADVQGWLVGRAFKLQLQDWRGFAAHMVVSHQTPTTKHQKTPTTKHQTPNTKRQTTNDKYRPKSGLRSWQLKMCIA
jgi:hypothetical protein